MVEPHRSEDETASLLVNIDSHNASEESESTTTLNDLSSRQRLLADTSNSEDVPNSKRKLGLLSAASLIFNRVIGTGIYATPSSILRSSGSVGMSLVMWLAGASIAACGSAVYTELGTGLPRSGGEKNYFEFIYRRPRFLATCVFSVYSIIANTGTANSVVFSEYLLNALSVTPTYCVTRFTAFLCLTFLPIMHGTALAPWGLRLQNTLGAAKLFVLSSIALCGLLSLTGVPWFAVREGYQLPDSFDSWDKFWEGSSGKGANAFVSGLYNVIWSFIGYSNANYALSEVRDPVRTIKRAAPLAMGAVTIVYMLVNVAYFAVVSKDDILGSKRIVAALFFRNIFGPASEKLLSAFIALSVLGNLLAGSFTQSRVIQELGREGVVPFSSFFSSNKPYGVPLRGLLVQYTLSCVYLFFVPPGDAYIFLINFASYCLNIVNCLVAIGLVLLHLHPTIVAPYTRPFGGWTWHPPFEAPKVIIAIYLFSTLFLAVVPFVPPIDGRGPYSYIPYWAHSAGGFAVSLIGIGYWYIWSTWLPRRGGYKLEREVIQGEDGISRARFRKVRSGASRGDAELDS